MAVVALVLLGGGGGGAYLYLTGSTAEAAPIEKEAGNHAKDESGGHGEEYTYVELDPLILPIIDEYGLNQVVSLVVSLEILDPTMVEKVEKMQPRLKDAFIQDMYGVLNRQAALKDGVVQVAKIKARLNKISKKVMGDDVIHDVLLQVVQQRPI